MTKGVKISTLQIFILSLIQLFAVSKFSIVLLLQVRRLVNEAEVQFTVVLLHFNYIFTVFVYSLSFILAGLMF